MTGTQYGHAGQHHGVGTPGCPTDLHHHHDEQCVSPLVERRQRAFETGLDYPHDDVQGLLDVAIETATRVRITPELLHEARPNAFITMTETRRIVEAAFRAAGFEVEQ